MLALLVGFCAARKGAKVERKKRARKRAVEEFYKVFNGERERMEALASTEWSSSMFAVFDADEDGELSLGEVIAMAGEWLTFEKLASF